MIPTKSYLFIGNDTKMYAIGWKEGLDLTNLEEQDEGNFKIDLNEITTNSNLRFCGYRSYDSLI